MVIKQVKHYIELIDNELDKLETALDDDMPDIHNGIIDLIEELRLEANQ